MEKDQIYLVELKQSELEYIVSVLDTVVKSHGLSVAEQCSNLHKTILEKSTPKPEEEKKEKVEIVEEVSLEEVEEELEQIMKVPKKKKRTTKKKK